MKLQLGQHSDSYRSQGRSSGKIYAEPDQTPGWNKPTCYNIGTKNDGFQAQKSDHQPKQLIPVPTKFDGGPQTQKSTTRH